MHVLIDIWWSEIGEQVLLCAAGMSLHAVLDRGQ